VQQNRRVTGEVLGEHQARALRTDRDLGYASAHRLDSEVHPCPEHVPVELEVSLDIPTRHIKDVKRLDRHGQIFPARADPVSSGPAITKAVVPMKKAPAARTNTTGGSVPGRSVTAAP
jgi:hypothetical protein